MTNEKSDYAPVSELLGYKLSTDGTTIMVGFKQPNGHEFVIGFPPSLLREVIKNLVSATAAISLSARKEEGVDVWNDVAYRATKFMFAKLADHPDYVLRMQLDSGAHFAFNFDQSFAASLREVLNAQAPVSPLASIQTSDIKN